MFQGAVPYRLVRLAECEGVTCRRVPKRFAPGSEQRDLWKPDVDLQVWIDGRSCGFGSFRRAAGPCHTG